MIDQVPEVIEYRSSRNRPGDFSSESGRDPKSARATQPIGNAKVGTITSDIVKAQAPSGESPLGDVIAAAHAEGAVEPWMHPSFVDVIAKLQRDRQIRASDQPGEVQFHDRRAVCTAALAV